MNSPNTHQSSSESMSHAFSKTTSDSASEQSRCPRSFMNHAFAMSPIFDGRTRFSTLATRMSLFASPKPSFLRPASSSFSPLRDEDEDEEKDEDEPGMSCCNRHEVNSVS